MKGAAELHRVEAVRSEVTGATCLGHWRYLTFILSEMLHPGKNLSRRVTSDSGFKTSLLLLAELSF